MEQIAFKQNGTTRMTTSKSFDLLNRLTRISSSSFSSSSFDYADNSANQRTAVTNADSSRWAYSYLQGTFNMTLAHPLIETGLPCSK